MRIKVAKCHRSITNKRNDSLHNLSSYLVNNYKTICLEDLNVKGMLQNHHLARAIQDASWYEFTSNCNIKAIGTVIMSSISEGLSQAVRLVIIAVT